MPPLLQALLSRWELRLDVLAVLILFGTLYTIGWVRLHRRHQQRYQQVERRGRSRQGQLATKIKLVSYSSGLILLAVALMSPIDRLGGQLFFMHMIQHLLTIMLVPPLLWLANPFPIILWGLPPSLRIQIGALFARDALFRRTLKTVTTPGISWFLFIGIYLGWHDPNAYNLALRREWVHNLEHLTFFGAAMLYWWNALNAAPRLHTDFPKWGRVAFLIGTVPPNMLAGVIISFSAEPVYTYYESIPRIWGVSVLQDQMLGGVIMWIPGSMMYILFGLLVLASILNKEPKAAPLSTKMGTAILVMMALLSALFLPTGVQAHSGGTPRVIGSEIGPYRLFVWTQPEPLHVGEMHLDLSVVSSQGDAASGNKIDIPVKGAQVEVTLLPEGPGEQIQLTASNEDLFNESFYETEMVIPSAGRWHVIVSVVGADGSGNHKFEIDVLQDRPIDWPLVIGASVALIVLSILMATWMVGQSRQRREAFENTD